MNLDLSILAKRISSGDEHAFRTFYNAYHQAIYTYAFRYFRSREVSEEVVQDVFSKIWISRAAIDPEKCLKAYAYRIARNTIFNQLKRAAHDQRMRETIFYQTQRHRNDVEETCFHDELSELYQQAIDKLPPQRRLVFTLSRDEGMTHDEIAKSLTISKNTVKDQIVKASRSIRMYINTSMKEHTVYSLFVSWMLIWWLSP